MLGRSITEMGSPWEDDPRRVSRRRLKTARSSVLRGPPSTGVGRYVNLDPLPGEVTTSVGAWAAMGLESRPQACQQHQDSRHAGRLARRPPPDCQRGRSAVGSTLRNQQSVTRDRFTAQREPDAPGDMTADRWIHNGRIRPPTSTPTRESFPRPGVVTVPDVHGTHSAREGFAEPASGVAPSSSVDWRSSKMYGGLSPCSIKGFCGCLFRLRESTPNWL